MDFTPNKKGVVTINLSEETYSDIDLSVLDNKKIKSVIINGNKENNEITGSKYIDTIYTGSGEDTVTASLGNDKIYSNADGEKTFNFKKGDGNDTLYSVKYGDVIRIIIGDSPVDSVKYIRNGNDLIVTYIPQIKVKKKITQQSDSIKLVNFFNDNVGNQATNITGLIFVDSNENENIVDLRTLQYEVSGKGILYGTVYNDKITGSVKVDTIYTKGGDDEIYAGAKNDIVIIDGEGEKTIRISNGDGNDTVLIQDDNAEVNLEIDENDILSYVQEDENLILSRTYEKGSSITTETTTINTTGDFYVNGKLFDSSKINSMYIARGKSKVIENLSGKNAVIAGGSKVDEIYSGANTNDSIFAGSGNDVIYLGNGENSVFAGKGKDTIYGADAKSNLFFKNGDGNDTLILSGELITEYDNDNNPIYDENVKINLYFDEGTKLVYRTNGEDLFIDRTFKSGKKDITETLTIKNLNLYNLDSYLNNVYINDGSLKNIINENGLSILGQYDKLYKKTEYSGLFSLKNTINYNTTGNAWMHAGNQDDTYNINTFNKKTGTIEIEDGGGEDTVTINTDAGNIRLLFNVEPNYDKPPINEYAYPILYEGKVTYTDFNEASDRNFEPYWYNSLLMFDKSQMTIANYNKLKENSKGIINAKGVVALNDYFTTYDEVEGYGADITTANFEHIKDSSGSDLIMTTAVQVIADRVSEVLINGNDYTGITVGTRFSQEYTSTYDIMERGTTAEKNAILNIYTNTAIGTDGNDSFISIVDTSKHEVTSATNDIFVAGKGNDTFSFSGKFGYDVIYSDTEVDEDGKALNTDTLIFKDYDLTDGKMQVLSSGDDLLINCYYANKKNYEDHIQQTVVYKNFFEPTSLEIMFDDAENILTPNVRIKDKNLTYDIDYRVVNEENYIVDWSNEVTENDTTNTKFLLLDNRNENGNNTIISSAAGYNIIQTNCHKGIYFGVLNSKASTTFYYKGGHDQYITDGYAPINIYNIDIFDENSDVYISNNRIYDAGDDVINFTNTSIDDLRILFNVNNDGSVGAYTGDWNYAATIDYGDTYAMSIYHSNVFNMNDLTSIMKSGKRQGVVKIENYFYTSYDWDTETEQSVAKQDYFIDTYTAQNNEEFDMLAWIDSIAENVSGWLTQKGYSCTWDAMDRANTRQLNELFQLYNVSYDTAVAQNEII